MGTSQGHGDIGSGTWGHVQGHGDMLRDMGT